MQEEIAKLNVALERIGQQLTILVGKDEERTSTIVSKLAQQSRVLRMPNDATRWNTTSSRRMDLPGEEENGQEERMNTTKMTSTTRHSQKEKKYETNDS